jgi:hypothetical protein
LARMLPVGVQENVLAMSTPTVAEVRRFRLS